jgi:hypothetical protein
MPAEATVPTYSRKPRFVASPRVAVATKTTSQEIPNHRQIIETIFSILSALSFEISISCQGERKSHLRRLTTLHRPRRRYRRNRGYNNEPGDVTVECIGDVPAEVSLGYCEMHLLKRIHIRFCLMKAFLFELTTLEYIDCVLEEMELMRNN